LITSLALIPFYFEMPGESDPIDHVVWECYAVLVHEECVFPVCKASSYEAWSYGFSFSQYFSLLPWKGNGKNWL
jgi:hypothetical protein